MSESILIVGSFMILFGLVIIAVDYYQKHKTHTH